MRLAAVCAIYGGYDLIPPVPEGVDDAVLVTDVPVRSGWRNVVEPSTDDPRLAAKRPKARPDLYTDCEASLWIDGSVHVRDGRFAGHVRRLLHHDRLVLMDHPEDRSCLYEEAEHCRGWPKYIAEPIDAQVAAYRAEGMPDGFGLWAAGLIARVHESEIIDLGEAWLSEMHRWSIQDQISLPYLLWREEVAFGTFGIDQLENTYFDLLPHAQEIRDHRRTTLGLESTIIHLRGEVAWLQSALEGEQAEHERLRSRRVVRIALSVARLFRPVVQRLRGAPYRWR